MSFDIEPSTTQEAPPSRRRTRWLAGLAAAMLVAAAGGVGFGIGRSVERDRISTASEDVPTTEAPADPPATIASEPDESSPADSADPGTSEPVPPPTNEDIDQSAAEDEPAVIEVASPAGGPGWTYGDGRTEELVFERTTDAGVEARAHLGQLWDEPTYVDETGWQQPGWCTPNGNARIALAGGAATGKSVIDVGSVQYWTEPFGGRAISWVTLGLADGNPHRVVFVQTPPGTTSVTASFADGSTDSTAPQNDVAVLVVPGAPDAIEHTEGGYTWYEERYDFSVTFDGGADPVTIADAEVGIWDNPDFQASCSPPPPALPEPGEQPADPAFAEESIIDTMSRIYSGGDGEFNEDRIDDPTGVAEAREQVREGGFESEAASAVAVVEELVFTSPSEAWFRYRIETDGIDLFERYGTAVAIDGVWKITRNTICQDLSMAGGDCGGDVRVIRPPGFEYDTPAVID